jgi:NAD(P)-dependent dehydrogenase (short-subunit alcohol dehydrogenase family)
MISLVADGLVEANIRNFLDIPTTDWRAIVDLNLYGSLNLSRAVLPVMVEQGQGRLVLVSSVSGLVGAGGLSIYSAAKGGVIAFAKSLAREFASKGISVNCVAPGGVATRAFPAGSASSGKRLERIAIGRLADPDEVANVIAYLAIEAPQYLVGEVISVSGGPP